MRTNNKRHTPRRLDYHACGEATNGNVERDHWWTHVTVAAVSTQIAERAVGVSAAMRARILPPARRSAVKGDVSFTGEVRLSFVVHDVHPGTLNGRCLARHVRRPGQSRHPQKRNLLACRLHPLQQHPGHSMMHCSLFENVCATVQAMHACMLGVNTFHMPALTLMNSRMDHPCSTGLFASVERGIHCLCNENPHR